MKTIPTLFSLALLFAAAPLTAGSHQGDRPIAAPEGQQPAGGKVERAGKDTAPRGGKPKPKPKPKPPKESGEKGGTEDINIGVGELQE